MCNQFLHTNLLFTSHFGATRPIPARRDQTPWIGNETAITPRRLLERSSCGAPTYGKLWSRSVWGTTLSRVIFPFVSIAMNTSITSSASVRPLSRYDAGRVGLKGRTFGNRVDATRDASSGAYPPECSRECANVATNRASVAGSPPRYVAFSEPVRKMDCEGRAPLSA